MHNDYAIDELMSLENAILVCFGETLEEELPQVESVEDTLIDALQDVQNLSRYEAESYLHRQI